MDKLSHLVSDVMQAFGTPAREYLDPEDAVRAARQSLAFYDLALSQSNQNHALSKKPFTAATRETHLPDVEGTPLWVEYQVGNSPYDLWHFVPAVNLASVEEAAARGDERCAFYDEQKGLRVVLSYVPAASTQHRLWYDPAPSLEFTLDDPIRSPASFYPMYAARAVRIAHATLLANAARAKNPPTGFQLEAWAAAAREAMATLEEYAPLWKQHRLGSRGGGQRGRMRRPVLGRR